MLSAIVGAERNTRILRYILVIMLWYTAERLVVSNLLRQMLHAFMTAEAEAVFQVSGGLKNEFFVWWRRQDNNQG